MPFTQKITIGRSSSNDWYVYDHLLSSKHFSVTPYEDKFIVADISSKNGTYVDGQKINRPTIVESGCFIKAGDCVFTIVDNINKISEKPSTKFSQYASGRFYFPSIADKVDIATRLNLSHKESILLEGEPGTGKELFCKLLSIKLGLCDEINVINSVDLHKWTALTIPRSGVVLINNPQQRALSSQQILPIITFLTRQRRYHRRSI